MHHHRLCEDETAHEEKDHRVCKGAECILGGDNTCHDSKCRTDERCDRDGNRFRNPPDGDKRHDSEKLVPFGG